MNLRDITRIHVAILVLFPDDFNSGPDAHIILAYIYRMMDAIAICLNHGFRLFWN